MAFICAGFLLTFVKYLAIIIPDRRDVVKGNLRRSLALQTLLSLLVIVLKRANQEHVLNYGHTFENRVADMPLADLQNRSFEPGVHEGTDQGVERDEGRAKQKSDEKGERVVELTVFYVDQKAECESVVVHDCIKLVKVDDT